MEDVKACKILRFGISYCIILHVISVLIFFDCYATQNAGSPHFSAWLDVQRPVSQVFLWKRIGTVS